MTGSPARLRFGLVALLSLPAADAAASCEAIVRFGLAAAQPGSVVVLADIVDVRPPHEVRVKVVSVLRGGRLPAQITILHSLSSPMPSINAPLNTRWAIVVTRAPDDGAYYVPSCSEASLRVRKSRQDTGVNIGDIKRQIREGYELYNR